MKRKNVLSILDLNISRYHDFLYRKNRWFTIGVSLFIYIAVVMFLGNTLKISSNYMVLIPVISISLSLGLWGGFFSGILALPFNLLLFQLLGHPEYSPESKVIAEISGIFLGTVLGYLSDFFTRIKEEIQRREISETTLSETLKEKELLLKEIHHRVKNNLNLIKSITLLQSNRVDNDHIKNECEKLNQRIFSISLVQDLLFSERYSDFLDQREYIKQLAESLIKGHHNGSLTLDYRVEDKPHLMENKRLTSLGLIVNEFLVNSFKYAFTDHPAPQLSIELSSTKTHYILKLGDNGPGIVDDSENSNGLGMKLITSLAVQLGGEARFFNDKGCKLHLEYPNSFFDIIRK